MVGGIGFFGPPAEDGSVELGDGLVEAVRGRGFATETLTALTRRALSKAGFSEVSRSGGLIFYAFG